MDRILSVLETWTTWGAVVQELFRDVLLDRPRDVITYLIDHLTVGREAAQQVPSNGSFGIWQDVPCKDIHGLSTERRTKIDAVYVRLCAAANACSCATLSAYLGDPGDEAEIISLFSDMDVDGDGVTSREDFHTFMSCISHTMSSSEFQRLVDALT